MALKKTTKIKTKKLIFICTAVVSSIAGTLLIRTCNIQTEKQVHQKNLYNTHCGSCHLVPDPENIPRHLWKHKVFPEMAKRMGIIDYSKGSRSYSYEEKHHIEINNAYPNKPLIDSVQWQQLKNYVLSIAPDSVPSSPERKGRNLKLTQFKSTLSTINNSKPIGGIVKVDFDMNTNTFLIGDVFGQLHEWNTESNIKLTLNSPIVSSVRVDNTQYVTEIGIMNPSEIPRGVIYRADSDSLIPLAKELHRPVYTEVSDLNNNGEKEIIICEFGHITGQLSLLRKKGTTLEKTALLALPGSAKVEVVDMNGDGNKDIVALFAQGREGIYIFYQKENLEFEVEQVITMKPEYGLSWFSLLDYNKDGDLDILLVNGDNADYSRFLKPYHGIRLFINSGRNTFKEEWFYPIHGATRVMADDFDLDGDFDFTVISFFPDFKNQPEEGFVYLENKDSSNYIFEPQTTAAAKNGNWLVMDKGDFDQDGDVDIMLGNFSLFPANRFKTDKKCDLLYLENTTIK